MPKWAKVAVSISTAVAGIGGVTHVVAQADEYTSAIAAVAGAVVAVVNLFVKKPN